MRDAAGLDVWVGIMDIEWEGMRGGDGVGEEDEEQRGG